MDQKRTQRKPKQKEMMGLTVTCSPPYLHLFPPHSLSLPRNCPLFSPPPLSRSKPAIIFKSASDPISSLPPQDNPEPEPEPEPELELESEDGFDIEVKKAGGKNRRIIQSRVRIEADLETVWSVLTDYEGLADFIPSLAVSQLVEKGENFARLYQVGQQDLALGLKFDAKCVLDCYERDVEYFPSGRRRDIEFKMVDGDFQTFEGRWSIEQINSSMYQHGELSGGCEFQTTLYYFVEVEPKLWLPIRLLEGRLCKEVKNSILCVREEAERVQKLGSNMLNINWWKTGENNPEFT